MKPARVPERQHYRETPRPSLRPPEHRPEASCQVVDHAQRTTTPALHSNSRPSKMHRLLQGRRAGMRDGRIQDPSKLGQAVGLPVVANSFSYTPLPSDRHIRVLDIEAARTPHARIHCHLRAVPLPLDDALPLDGEPPLDDEATAANMIEERIKYWTLSYAWGETHPDGSHFTDSIVCDGRPLRVTANLLAALKRLRSKLEEVREELGRSPHLWVDAICINQSDLVERSQQVRLMADTYARSDRLIVWLGESEITAEDNKLADVLKAYNHDLRGWSTYYGIFTGFPIITWLRKRRMNARYDALDRVINRPWFKRRWVLQEYLITDDFKRHIMAGSWYGSAKDFASALEARKLTYKSGPSGPIDVREESRRIRLSRLLLDLLFEFEDSQCADPRDRVYALLSISDDCNGNQPSSFCIEPGYSLSVESAYFAIAKALLSPRKLTGRETSWAFKEGDILGYDVEHLLASATTRESLPHSHRGALPSWVADWRVPLSYTSNHHEQAVWYSLFLVHLRGRGFWIWGLMMRTRSASPPICLFVWRPSASTLVNTLHATVPKDRQTMSQTHDTTCRPRAFASSELLHPALMLNFARLASSIHCFTWMIFEDGRS